MCRLIYLAAARRDLVSIFEYVARRSGSIEVGRGFVGQLRQHCTELASLPGALGRARPELRFDIRSSPCKGYVIFFRYRGDTVEIVNVIEGHRDIEAYFEALPPV